jgi:thiosulfate/3-mercaptopyruvate sulfurtransferase
MGHAFKTTRAAILERPAGTQLVDARSMGRFVGDVDEPWKNVYPDIKMGHIPGSRVLPHTDLGADETGAFLSLEALAELWRKAGVDLTKPIIVTCGSGVTAARLMASLFMLGCFDVTLYDGSWNEWWREGPIGVGPPEE